MLALVQLVMTLLLGATPPSQIVRLRDDGFPTTQWDRISKTVEGALTAAGKPCAMSGFASLFDDDEEEPDRST